MNLGDIKTADVVADVLPDEDDDDAVDPHLQRIKNEAGGDESDDEVNCSIHYNCGDEVFLQLWLGS